MPEKIVGIGADAVASATDRDWDHWLAELDARDAREMEHREIVAALADAGVESEWWQQTIANAYEVERGMRAVGETADAGFQIGVQRTLPIARRSLWELLVSSSGRALWLGDCPSFDADPGFDYETEDGTAGEVRTVKAGERLRMTWRPADRDDPTTLQLTLTCPRNTEERTTLRIHHEKLGSAVEREAMREHWREVLERIEDRVAPAGE